MRTMASQIMGISIVCSTFCSGADQRKYQSFTSLAFVRGIHQWLVDSPHKGPVAWKIFPFMLWTSPVLQTRTEYNANEGLVHSWQRQPPWPHYLTSLNPTPAHHPPLFAQQFACSTSKALIVRRAGLLWSQQDFEWRWSVPLFKCLTVLEFSFILFDLCLLITFFNFIMNYVPIVTFWIFTYHKIWILSIMFCFIWSYWIIYFLACLEVSWRVVS